MLEAAQAQSGNTPPGTSDAPHPVAPAKPADPAKVKAEASYSLGLSVGTQLQGLGVGEDSLNYERVMAGLRAALSGKGTFGPKDGERVQALIQDARTAAGNTNKAAADKFLAENGKKPGIVTTASGLQYRIVREGSGTPPKAADSATVNYRGVLLNGEEFDSSYKSGRPVTFPVGGVIKGWTEALQLMKPGSKWELYVPPELGYGMNPPPGAPIPPGALLKFEVELLSVKPAPTPGLSGSAPDVRRLDQK